MTISPRHPQILQLKHIYYSNHGNSPNVYPGGCSSSEYSFHMALCVQDLKHEVIKSSPWSLPISPDMRPPTYTTRGDYVDHTTIPIFPGVRHLVRSETLSDVRAVGLSTQAMYNMIMSNRERHTPAYELYRHKGPPPSTWWRP